VGKVEAREQVKLLAVLKKVGGRLVDRERRKRGYKRNTKGIKIGNPTAGRNCVGKLKNFYD